MSRHRYPRRALLRDTLEAAIGFAVAAGLLRYAQPAGPLIWILAAAAGLFLVYFARAFVRHLTRIEVDAEGIRTLGPLGVAIPWVELRAVRLDHYTTRSDRSGGWMQLVVGGRRASIRIDSSLSGFVGVAAAAGSEALRHGARLDGRTRRNLDALGIHPYG